MLKCCYLPAPARREKKNQIKPPSDTLKKNHLQSHIIVSDTHEILSCPRAVPKEKLNIHPEKSIVY